MKLFRVPKKGGYWNHTDTKEPSEYIENWHPGKRITLDATIDKDGERHSEIGLELYEDDVISLFNSLVSNYKKKIKDLENEINYLKEESNEKDIKIDNLENAFLKLYRLTSSHVEKAPNDKVMIETINEIADFFYFSIDEACNTSPEIEWIDWNSI